MVWKYAPDLAADVMAGGVFSKAYDEARKRKRDAEAFDGRYQRRWNFVFTAMLG